MAEPGNPDHDQRLKVLLKEFFAQFLLCFFPDWASRFLFDAIDWLDKEVFLDPPRGQKRELDLVAKLRLREGVEPPAEGFQELVALVHVELESRASAAAFRPRMYEYYVQLRRDAGLPVWPIGVFLRVGMEGVGWDAYEEHFWDRRVLRFEYAYVGLPALDGEKHATGENLIGVALSTLMKVPPERRAELCAAGLKRITNARENDYRRFLLSECLEAYADLDEGQKRQLQSLLATEPYQEVKPSMITTYERGKIAGRLENALEQLEEKFGPLSADVKQRVEALPPEQLRQLTLSLLKAGSLKELGLEA